MISFREAYTVLCEFLSPLHPLFGNAGFFIVPIFMILAVFNISAFRRRMGSVVFGSVAVGMMSVYLIFAPPVGRYLLIPLLLCGCFSGAGVALMCDILCRIPWLRRLPKNIVLVFFTVCFVACGVYKIAQRNRVQAMPAFAKVILSDISKDAVVIGVDCAGSQKLGGLLRDRKNIAFFNFKTWQEALDILIPRQTQDLDFYFCVKMPKRYNISDYRLWFRSMYSIFPFDMIGEATKGKNRFVLLKFNSKVLDGRQRRIRSNALRMAPEPIVAKKWDKNWFAFAPMDFVKLQDLDASAFFKFHYGTFIDGMMLTRFFGETIVERTLSLHNGLGWPEALCVRSAVPEKEMKSAPGKQEQSAVAAKSSLPHDACGEKNMYPAADEPLLLQPKSIPVISEHPFIHVSGFAPLWSPDGNRLVMEGEEIRIDSGAATKTIQIADISTGMKASATFAIDRISLENIRDRKLKILLVEDNQNSRLNLNSSLQRILPSGSSVDSVQLGHSEFCSFSVQPLPEFPARKYHAVVLNVFGDAIVRPWSVPFKIDPFFDEHLTPLMHGIRERSPDTPLLLLLPPPPSAAPSLYPICDSPFFGRLSHFRICRAAERWMERNTLGDLHLVPLYAALDPMRDYAVQTKIGNRMIYSGFVFTEQARLRLAETVAGMIVRELERKKSKDIEP